MGASYRWQICVEVIAGAVVDELLRDGGRVAHGDRALRTIVRDVNIRDLAARGLAEGALLNAVAQTGEAETSLKLGHKRRPDIVVGGSEAAVDHEGRGNLERGSHGDGNACCDDEGAGAAKVMIQDNKTAVQSTPFLSDVGRWSLVGGCGQLGLRGEGMDE